MNPPVCRLLPFVTAGGAWQMAADEVMLEAAAEGTASLRVYAWSEATLSLGYFEPAADRLSDPLLASLPYVRRASGGAALVHDRELTYALALPEGPPWQTRGESSVRQMHIVLQDVFASYGVATVLCERERKLGEVLCFLHHTRDDLLLGDAKIVGSARRKMRGALVQHGGILLAQSPHTPALPGVAERTGVSLTTAQFLAALSRCLAQRSGWRLKPDDWTEAERLHIDVVSRTKYASSAWNDKR
jgi:lipoate-protein ligase A